ncbi:hypothetical protein ACIBG7_26705 [Nonomuraea sp. NPDC050328]|uniref:hypothetical protein n=1 Tax=Nonomuraea sp. NPDC050328 TaxID=3364361 RepID=UPI0037883C85
MSRIAIFSEVSAYTASQLPQTTVAAVEQRDAVAVICGQSGWVKRAADALTAGACALVVAAPQYAPPQEVARLIETAGKRPVVLDRPRLPADVADAARPPTPHAVVIDAGGPAATLSSVAADAAGWGRTLAGELVMRQTSMSLHALVALCESRTGVAVTLAVSAMEGPVFLDGHALHATRTRVTADELDDTVVLRWEDRHGVREQPRVFETAARRSLRRVVDALRSAVEVHDLPELLHDVLLADALLSGTPASR